MKTAGRPRKEIPSIAAKEIERLASTGASMVEIANALGVGKDLLRKWLAQNEALTVALTRGREVERQALHGRLYRAAMQGNTVALLFLLKTRHGYDDRAARPNQEQDPSDLARQIRAALQEMDKSVEGPPGSTHS
jgi:hypothetical protein